MAKSAPCEDQFVYVGAVAPEYVEVTVEPGESGIDLSTAVVGTSKLLVIRENGETSDWTVTFSSQSAEKLVLKHDFAAGDVDTRETLVLVPVLTVSGGTVRAKAVKLYVREYFA